MTDCDTSGGGGMPHGCLSADSGVNKGGLCWRNVTPLSLWRAFVVQKGSFQRPEQEVAPPGQRSRQHQTPVTLHHVISTLWSLCRLNKRHIKCLFGSSGQIGANCFQSLIYSELPFFHADIKVASIFSCNSQQESKLDCIYFVGLKW